MAGTTNSGSGTSQSGVVVDPIVGERDGRIDAAGTVAVEPTSIAERAVRTTSPTNWWLLGLLALAIVIAILFAMQMLNGAPGTAVQSGTPTSEPVVPAPAAP